MVHVRVLRDQQYTCEFIVIVVVIIIIIIFTLPEFGPCNVKCNASSIKREGLTRAGSDVNSSSSNMGGLTLSNSHNSCVNIVRDLTFENLKLISKPLGRVRHDHDHDHDQRMAAQPGKGHTQKIKIKTKDVILLLFHG